MGVTRSRDLPRRARFATTLPLGFLSRPSAVRTGDRRWLAMERPPELRALPLMADVAVLDVNETELRFAPVPAPTIRLVCV